MKFDQLILRRIVKIVATICQILRLHQNRFRLGLGELTALPQTPIAGFKGPYF